MNHAIATATEATMKNTMKSATATSGRHHAYRGTARNRRW